MDLRAGRKVIETMIFIHAEDLESKMRSRLGASASLDDAKVAARFLKAFLRESFVLTGEDGKAVEFQWVGMEVRTHFVVAYVEFPAVAPGALQLSNRILLDDLADQVNTVRVKLDGKDQADLVFDRGRAAPQPLFALRPRQR